MSERKLSTVDNLKKLDTDYYSKSVVESLDSKPYYQYKVGFLDEQFVPVYGYLKFGFLPTSSKYFAYKDKKGREVFLFRASQGDPDTISIYKAYRYSSGDDFIYDNEPIRPPFLASNQRIDVVDASTANYIVVRIVTSSGGTNTYTHSLVHTNGSYDASDWRQVLDLDYHTSYRLSIYNSISIDETENRIYEIRSDNGSGSFSASGIIIMKVYDLNNGGFLGEHQLFDMSTQLYTGSYQLTSKSLNYGGLVSTFNYKTGELLVVLQTIIYYKQGTGTRYITKNINLSYNLSTGLRQTGTGMPSTNIPINDSNYDFFGNGTAVGHINIGGRQQSLSYNEYDNGFYYIYRSTWVDIGAHISLLEFDTPVTSTTNGLWDKTRIMNEQRVIIPDSSPWAKTIYRNAIITDSYFIGAGQSSKYNGTEQFISKYTYDGSSVSMVAGQWKLLKDANSDSSIMISDTSRWCVYKNNTQIKYYILDSSLYINEVNISSDLNITYTNTGVRVPVSLPSGYVRYNTWGYDWNSNFVWMVRDDNDNKRTKLAWTNDNGATWSISDTVNSAHADASMNAYGSTDTNPVGSVRSNTFIENGVVYVNESYRSVGGTYTTPYNSLNFSTGTLSVHTRPCLPYDGGNTIGFNNTIGYFLGFQNGAYYSQRYMSASQLQDVIDSGNATEFRTVVSTSSGLGATLLNFPVYINGRYYQSPTTDVALQPNSINYIYLEVMNEGEIEAYSDTLALPNTSTRLLIGNVTTDAANPISQESYNLVDDSSRKPKYLYEKIKITVTLNEYESHDVSSADYGLTNFDKAIFGTHIHGTNNNYIFDNSALNYSLNNNKSILSFSSNAYGTTTFTVIIMKYLG